MNTHDKLGSYVRDWVKDNRYRARLISSTDGTFRNGNKLDHFIASTDILSPVNSTTLNIGMEHKVITIDISTSFTAIKYGVIVKKWSKTDWGKFTATAHSRFESIVLPERKLNSDEIENAVVSWTTVVQGTIDQVVPKGRIGSGANWEIPQEIDHWYRERRRFKCLLQKENKKWDQSIGRIIFLKGEIKEASKKIKQVIWASREKRLLDSISKINSGHDRFKVIRSLTTPVEGTKEFLLKKEDGTGLDSNEDKTECLEEFYS